MDFAFLIKLPLSCSMTLCTFLLYSPHTVEKKSEQAVWVFGCWPGSSHHNTTKLNFKIIDFWKLCFKESNWKQYEKV